jgi:hypothetical protein
LGVGHGLKDRVGGLGNCRSYFVTLLSTYQQKITQKRKVNKHSQSTFRAKEIIIGFATLFISIEPKKTQ